MFENRGPLIPATDAVDPVQSESPPNSLSGRAFFHGGRGKD
jgi:hypothetical protein